MEAAAALGALASIPQEQSCLQHLVAFVHEVLFPQLLQVSQAASRAAGTAEHACVNNMCPCAVCRCLAGRAQQASSARLMRILAQVCCGTVQAETTAEAAALPDGAVAPGQLCLPAANAATLFVLLVRRYVTPELLILELATCASYTELAATVAAAAMLAAACTLPALAAGCAVTAPATGI